MSRTRGQFRGGDALRGSPGARGRTPEEVFAERVSYSKRRLRGQFFTPPAVAEAMVRWACGHGPASFLDPSVGPGIFVNALARSGVSSVRQVVAVDVDAAALDLARRRIDAGRFDSVDLRQADFLEVSFDGPFDAIVCNPPYIRHHEARLPEAVFRRFERGCGVRLSRLTNVYCLFLLRVMSLLSDRGRAAVITPTEFLNADFGRAVKQVLLGCPAFRGFVVIDHGNSVFDGILTTATITLFDTSTAGEAILFSEASDSEGVAAALGPFGGNGDGLVPAAGASVISMVRSGLDPGTKWSTSAFGASSGGGRDRLRQLSDFASCKRGIATGANAFFTLTVEEARTWRVPDAVLRPCLTKAAQARRPCFDGDDYDALAAGGKKCLLLDVRPETATAAVRAYLDLGESLGVDRRYLTRHRRPWYVSERRPPADLLVTVFGRKRLRFVLNRAGVLNLTAFHCVYLKPAYRRFIGYLTCYFYSTAAARSCAMEHRVYGDGLLKFEPKDVGRLGVPDLDGVSSANLAAADAVLETLLACGSWEIDGSLHARIDRLFD